MSFTPYDALIPCCTARCYAKYKEAREKEKKRVAREKKAVSVSALTTKADKLWSEIVKNDWGNACAYC